MLISSNVSSLLPVTFLVFHRFHFILFGKFNPNVFKTWQKWHCICSDFNESDIYKTFQQAAWCNLILKPLWAIKSPLKYCVFDETHINLKLSGGGKQQMVLFLIHLLCEFEKHISRLQACFNDLLAWNLCSHETDTLVNPIYTA